MARNQNQGAQAPQRVVEMDSNSDSEPELAAAAAVAEYASTDVPTDAATTDAAPTDDETAGGAKRGDGASVTKKRSPPVKPREDGTESWRGFTHTSWMKSLQDHLARCEDQAAKMDGGHRPSVEFVRIKRMIVVAEERMTKYQKKAADARAEAAKAREERLAKRKAESPENADANKRGKDASAGAFSAKVKALLEGGMDVSAAFKQVNEEFGL